MTSTIQAGSIISSRFEIEAEIGRGGMATVYRAKDLHLGRPVALKVFETLDDSDAARRKAEMHALATLSHPNLVSLFDAELGVRHPNYLVMELVDGPSLRQAISDGGMTGQTIAEVAIGVSKALSAVHSAGPLLLIGALPSSDGARDDIRRVVVGILDELGVESPLARDSRRRLASALY